MFKRNLWKLTLSLVIVLWAAFQLIPIQDRDFATYIKAEASTKKTEFNALLKEASERKNPAGQPLSVFVGLKQIAAERNLDLAKDHFPHLNLGDVKNPERRNKLLLDHLLKESKSKLQLGLDLKGGVAFTLEVDDKAFGDLPTEIRQEKLKHALTIISDRVNSLGVAEPVVRAVGDNRIEVQLPGVNTRDNPEALEILKKPARLDFRIVMQGTNGSLQAPPPGSVPPGYEVLSTENEDHASGQINVLYYIVKRVPEMSGQGVEDAIARVDEFGRYQIHLNFNDAGKKQFADVTTANVGRQLAIVLDGKLSSAPNINEPITGGSAQISGNFTQREALELANVLNNPLDVPLVIKEQYEIGATLATDAISSAKLSFIISTLLTIGFVLIFYTIGGVIAAIGMGVNVIVTLAVMSSFGATLSMPGIAGIVLTLAMSVDSNILIFERMKEELKLGKSLASSLEAGFEKAWSAIIDSNLTTLGIGVIMIVLGTGPVKGFGITLSIGIFTTMFAAVVVTKLIMEFLILPGVIKKMPMFSVLQNTKFDFLKYAKPAFIISWVIVLACVGFVAYKGKAVYGIDFVGGDTVTLAYSQRVDVGDLRKAATAGGFEDATFFYQKQIGSDVEALKATTRFDEGAPLVTKLQQSFPQAKFVSLGETRIGPSVGAEIQSNAFWSIFWALVLILAYVAFRFEIGYGIGAVVSTLHDLLITIGLFVLFGREFNASMVAAILLIAGYSINDTIVVFDRIREELRLNPETKLRDLINRSLNLTLSRTVITGGTTLLTAVTLILITTGEVNDIAFTLLIGVITGTFSSLFIACPVFYWWHKGDRKHVEQHQDVKPTYEWTGSSKASQ
ncbi:protein translocase subunit SecDF [Nibricoccus aquaticus]|uniref:Multifunctional fusion protein n=1 Tax=Nibricoccus aquaticus TaxID=2576891 RepID=A0A290QE92_9BACT|nr:protein translocase subunit SecD [Nibricoccus aquaticus]ATC62661.1 protein translocase subunit SecDF [Nibricoccus aquaticus]